MGRSCTIETTTVPPTLGRSLVLLSRRRPTTCNPAVPNLPRQRRMPPRRTTAQRTHRRLGRPIPPRRTHRRDTVEHCTGIARPYLRCDTHDPTRTDAGAAVIDAMIFSDYIRKRLPRPTTAPPSAAHLRISPNRPGSPRSKHLSVPSLSLRVRHARRPTGCERGRRCRERTMHFMS